MSNWISIKDRLPIEESKDINYQKYSHYETLFTDNDIDKFTCYLCLTPKKQYRLAVFHSNNFWEHHFNMETGNFSLKF